MESWKPKMNIAKPSGRFKPNAACKKHPKHRQSPGVCSICLREKLSQLNNSTSSREIKAANNCGSSSSSSSSYISSLSSSDVSSCSSPVVINHRRRMEYSDLGRKSMRVFKNNNNNGGQDLKKSRSMAVHLVRRRKEDIHIMDTHEKRGAGFWSKFLPRKNNKGLMQQHSRTM